MKTKNKSFPQIAIKRVVVNPEQPRQFFEPTELEELAGSIRQHGVIEPIVVEECGDDYILHDGERRWRAARMAGLTMIPAVISPPLNGTGPRERLERALVANVQRAEMHPIEEGMAYQRLITEFGYSIKGVAQRIGKHYTRVHSCLQLLQLEPEIQQIMLERRLPCADSKILPALLSVPAGDVRVKLAQALAAKNATANMIVNACYGYLAAKSARKFFKTQKGKAAIAISKAESMIQKEPAEWDALFQVGKVPPWQVVTNAVMTTCDACPLRPEANEVTCAAVRPADRTAAHDGNCTRS
jgi:ParB family chromosome partitioning protein